MAAHTTLLILLTFYLITFATSISPGNPQPLQKIHQFPNGSWVENIAVRPNGNIMVTLASTPELWEVKPEPQPPNQARLVYRFPNARMATGITEVAPDVFAVATENSVWRFDFNDDTSTSPVLRQVTTISSSGSLNGMATLNHASETVAIADCEAGLVWKLDTNTGEYEVMLKDETMAANKKIGVLLGINGLKVHDGYVYYVNTPERLFCRIPVDTKTGRQLGPREIISQGVLADDFAISEKGVAYLAALRDNIIVQVSVDGRRQIVAGRKDSRELMSVTSAVFDRQEEVLYITNGGETLDAMPISTAMRGGKVMVLRLDQPPSDQPD